MPAVPADEPIYAAADLNGDGRAGLLVAARLGGGGRSRTARRRTR
jgi:hypothetical protein